MNDCKIIAVVHFLGWCFPLNGNISKLRKIITTKTKDEIREKRCRPVDSERNAERHYYADNNRTKVQEAGQLKDLREASILY